MSFLTEKAHRFRKSAVRIEFSPPKNSLGGEVLKLTNLMIMHFCDNDFFNCLTISILLFITIELGTK